jgi:2-polyprenyl-3-methyl-5-hydroxy-6-metoxy-1,4-benzoquinol methylase
MNCPVCFSLLTIPALSGRDVLFETSAKTFTLDSCSACGCLFMNPMPASDEIARFYPNQYWWNSARPSVLKKVESVYRKFALRDHVRFITRAAASGGSLLDIGCGSGTLLGLLKERGFRVMGLDLSAEAAKIAEIQHGVQVVVDSLAEAGFAAESFDIVTLFHVLEHVSNPRDMLANVWRILRPEGVIVLQVPNIDSWQFRAFRSKWYGLDIPRHIIDYSKRSMLKLLDGSGFMVTRVKHFNLRDNAPALISSLFPSLDPLSRAVRQQKRNISENPITAWARHLVYFLMVIAAYPFAILESACGRGATLMIEARKK